MKAVAASASPAARPASRASSERAEDTTSLIRPRGPPRDCLARRRSPGQSHRSSRARSSGHETLDQKSTDGPRCDRRWRRLCWPPAATATTTTAPRPPRTRARARASCRSRTSTGPTCSPTPRATRSTAPTSRRAGRSCAQARAPRSGSPRAPRRRRRSRPPSQLDLDLGTVKRPDGGQQLTFKGMPLYTFTQEGAGQLDGDGVADDFNGTHFVWTAATSTGPGRRPWGPSSTRALASKAALPTRPAALVRLLEAQTREDSP